MANRYHSCIFPIFLSAAIILQTFSITKCSTEDAVWPTNDGIDIITDQSLAINISNIDEGYVVANITDENTDRKKIRIAKGNEEIFYDVEEDTAVIPVNMGSGTYKIGLYENVVSDEYENHGSVCFETEEENEENAFLCPNEFVKYTKDSPCVIYANDLCKGMSGKEAFETIKKCISQSFVYDYIKAISVTKETDILPDIDGCFEKHMGICQDLACMAAAMLRSQGVPCKVCIGMADGQYHAWLEIMLDEKSILYDPTRELVGKEVSEYTEERFY